MKNDPLRLDIHNKKILSVKEVGNVWIGIKVALQEELLNNAEGEGFKALCESHIQATARLVKEGILELCEGCACVVEPEDIYLTHGDDAMQFCKDCFDGLVAEEMSK